MTPSQIISESLRQLGENPQKGLKAAAMLINSGKGIMLQQNDSILILDKLKPHEVLAHLFTLDSPVGLADSAIELSKKIEQGKIKKVYAGTNDKKIINMFKNTKHSFSVEDAKVLPKPKKQAKKEVIKTKAKKGEK